jgi:GMP synthase-like glutamine amidotransferase
MILLISTCSEKLNEEEFVKPIAKIAEKNYEIKHYTEKIDLKKYEKIIICGTALRDNLYLNNLNHFNWVKEYNNPLLGICSGMQVIALQFGAKLVKKKEIGMTKIKTTKQNILFDGDFETYELHGNGLSDLNQFEILAKSENTVQAIKHKSKIVFGIMFHPEVRNSNIISNFIKAKL